MNFITGLYASIITAFMHTHTRTCLHTHSHTHTYTHAHTHTHTHNKNYYEVLRLSSTSPGVWYIIIVDIFLSIIRWKIKLSSKMLIAISHAINQSNQKHSLIASKDQPQITFHDISEVDHINVILKTLTFIII